MLEVVGPTLGGNSCSDFNVGLFNANAVLDWFVTAATIFGALHPFTIGVSQAVDGNDTDASLVVTAVTGSEADSPASLRRISIHPIKNLDWIQNLLEVACRHVCSAPSLPWRGQPLRG